jgi:hypothetical protein
VFDYSPESPAAVAYSSSASAPDVPRSHPIPPRPIGMDPFGNLGSGDGQASGHVHSLIRRMTSASVATRLSRLSEEWVEPLEAQSRLEIEFEKELWLLTELLLGGAMASVAPALTSLGQVLPVPAVKRAVRILDVASRPADVHQLAALQPGARIAHLSASAATPYPLPSNVAGLPIPAGDLFSLALGDGSFDHVRAAPAAAGGFTPPQLKAFMHESHRVLAVRGLLEFRFIDPHPVDAGPNTSRWIDSSLLLVLESTFRCVRPAALIPLWAQEAGFELLCCRRGGDGDVESVSSQATVTDIREMVVCVDEESATVDERLEAELCKSLLRNQYPSVRDWVWEVQDCRDECIGRKTKLRAVTLFGFKS